MLLYASIAPPKTPKRRSRSGCIRCKEKKKKCNEQRPYCDRCIERNLDCEYEAVKPRKRRKTSVLRQELEAKYFNNPDQYDTVDEYNNFETAYINESVDWNDSPAALMYEEAESCASFPTFANDQNPNDVCSDVEEIVRNDSFQEEKSVLRCRNRFPDLAMIAPSPCASPLLDFNAPVYLEFSCQRNRRALIDHFCNVLSHLIVFKEDTGNPFRQLVLPLSTSSSPVLNAIFALSSAHLEYGGVETEEKSLDFHNRALQGLAKLIDQNDKSKRDEILGAIMLLVYYEVLVQRDSANIVNSHLRGAMTIISQTQNNPNPTCLFLERAFRFYDVITALSLGTPPISPTAACNQPYPPLPDHNSCPMSNVDTLLGASTTLWPIIYRLSDLLTTQADLRQAEEAKNTSKACVLRSEFESTSAAIEIALTNWAPQISISDQSVQDNLFSDSLLDLDQGTTSSDEDANSITSCSSESDPRLQSILSNAEAYRQAALIYLYRYIRLLPTTSSIVQKHTKLGLAACSRVVECRGPMSALLWPLFISACEAVEETDRNLAKDVFAGVNKRQGMTNIGKARDMVEEVWRRGDVSCTTDTGSDCKGKIPARQICAEMGFSIVFG